MIIIIINIEWNVINLKITNKGKQINACGDIMINYKFLEIRRIDCNPNFNPEHIRFPELRKTLTAMRTTGIIL